MFGLKPPVQVNVHKSITFTPNGLDAYHALDSLPMQPIAAPSPTPNAPPALAEAESLLTFLITEWNRGQVLLQKFPRSSSTLIPDQAVRSRQYRFALHDRQSVVHEPSTDVPLLMNVLRAASDSGGFIREAEVAVNALKAPRLDKNDRTTEHKKLIADERAALVSWARRHLARREHERDKVPVLLHSRTRSVRPAFGLNPLQFSEMELDKFAEFAMNLEDESFGAVDATDGETISLVPETTNSPHSRETKK